MRGFGTFNYIQEKCLCPKCHKETAKPHNISLYKCCWRWYEKESDLVKWETVLDTILSWNNNSKHKHYSDLYFQVCKIEESSSIFKLSSGKDTSENTSKDTSKDTSENTSKDTSENTSKDTSEDTNLDGSEDMSSNESEDTNLDGSKDTSSNESATNSTDWEIVNNEGNEENKGNKSN